MSSRPLNEVYIVEKMSFRQSVGTKNSKGVKSLKKAFSSSRKIVIQKKSKNTPEEMVNHS